MRVTKWGECGILCALYLAKHHGGPPIGAAEIAQSQGLDLQYTQQVLQRLRKGSVIESVRGPHGGYCLVRAPQTTTLKEILYAAEGDTFEIICDYAPIHPDAQSPSACTDRDSCGLHTVWQELRTAIDKLLDERTLAGLLAMHQSHDTLVQLGARHQDGTKTT